MSPFDRLHMTCRSNLCILCIYLVPFSR